MPDCHTRWNSVRIDNHVWHDALNSEWEVFLAVGHSTGALLSVSTRKFVSNLGHLNHAHLHFDQPAQLFVRRQNYRVNVALLTVTQGE